ncbi:MAG: putative enzyme related to lactoylglutathione lyase [Candidatus Paceibacteria bacterium]|jgi:predicted enzyme related to lactoylglutathione lyase
MTTVHRQIQYIEFLSQDFGRIKKFYETAFGWEFTDWSPTYTAFAGEYVEGGFGVGDPVSGSILPILYSDNPEASLEQVRAAGGVIVLDIFNFPGGRRFEFTDPDGNRLAVWTKE